MIEIQDLVFEYPGHRALDGVSLTIADKAITALVGPNGAGKTTLLRCMAALETPYAGRVSIDGLDTREALACRIFCTSGTETTAWAPSDLDGMARA